MKFAPGFAGITSVWANQLKSQEICRPNGENQPFGDGIINGE
jgi:hypothetical protein